MWWEELEWGKPVTLQAETFFFKNKRSFYNIKSVNNRFGSADFIIPLLKDLYNSTSGFTHLSVQNCLKLITLHLPSNSVIFFEEHFYNYIII